METTNNDLTLTADEVSKKLFEIAGNSFIYIMTANNKYKLYCFDGKIWDEDTWIMEKFIADDLFKYYKKHIKKNYSNNSNYNQLKKQVYNLEKVKFGEAVVKAYKAYGVKYIDFDSKWNLLGFDDCVYDLEEGAFRDYKFDDYVSTTTGYEWRDPTQEELDTMNNIIKQIMPDEAVRKLYLEILSTSLEGRSLGKLILFNGHGGNGKGLIDDLLEVALGDYAITANNSLLTSKGSSGLNPEKTNLIGKRFTIYRQPPIKSKLKNPIIKDLLSNKFKSTIVCECNRNPLFSEKLTDDDRGMLIDVYFPSMFTDREDEVDESKHIYKSNNEYKGVDFQEQHKYALLQILMDAHKDYAQRNYQFDIPQSIVDRTNKYF